MKVIRVTPTEQVFPITWNLGIRCNYDCMYCPNEWHDNVSKHKTLSELQQAWKNVFEKTSERGLKYKFTFTGGEVTVNKNFLPFLQWLRLNYVDVIDKVIVTTNGSASLNYYKNLIAVVDNIAFSVHSEHIDEKKFFNTVLKIHKSGKFVHVNIMNEFWNTERIAKYKKILAEHNISHSINEIDYKYQTREYPVVKGKLNLEI